MTDQTNQCKAHSGLETCAKTLKIEVNEKLWPTIRNITTELKSTIKYNLFFWVIAGVIAGTVFLFGLNRSAISDCLQADLEHTKCNLEKIENNKEIFHSIDKRLSNIETAFGLDKK